jgi:hypothetical protein
MTVTPSPSFAGLAWSLNVTASYRDGGRSTLELTQPHNQAERDEMRPIGLFLPDNLYLDNS